jgi:ribonuclease HII
MMMLKKGRKADSGQALLFADAGASDSLYLEKALWRAGHRFIAGVDEAGRGPLAGPVVAAAVVLRQNPEIEGVADSKALSPAARESLFPKILQRAVAVYATAVWMAAIDRDNILEAAKAAMLKSVNGLDVNVSHALIDGNQKLSMTLAQTTIVKGDARSMSIGAASIIAKVMRDRIMLAMHELWPLYNFAANKGYGTPQHIKVLEEIGPCPIHRKSFRPVERCLSSHQ